MPTKQRVRKSICQRSLHGARWTTCILVFFASLNFAGTGDAVQAATDPATTAIEISQLEARGSFSEIYDQMHPDAQRLIPRSAVVGWYVNDFAPLGPGVITVTGVRYVTWTWPVTGKTYQNTAEVSFQQPFADGTIAFEVVRLVESSGEWHWFFGRSLEFVEEQIIKYSPGEVAATGSTGSCQGSAEWWKVTMPNMAAASYLGNTLTTLMGGGKVDQQLLLDYSSSFELLESYQSELMAPGAGITIQSDLVHLLDLYENLAENVAALISGMNPLAESGAQSAVIQGADAIASVWLSLPVDVDAFLTACEPLVVFVYGMGEDLPIGVLPGEIGPDVPKLDCDTIVSQVNAQKFFEASGSGDPHGIDGDGDGRACEVGE